MRALAKAADERLCQSRSSLRQAWLPQVLGDQLQLTRLRPRIECDMGEKSLASR